MTTTTQKIPDSGSILGLLPAPPDVRTRLLLAENLRGLTTAESWLPEGLWPELDDLREEHLRFRRQVVAVIEERASLLARYAAEDKDHVEALRQAARDGVRPPDDGRTPPDERERQRTAIEERLWAGIAVMAEHADAIVEHLRENEDEYLADLRERLLPAQQKRREAERLLAQAQSEELQVHALGRWVMTTNDDDGLSRQPSPVPGAVPERLAATVLRDSLERPWHKARPWSRATSEVAA